MLVCHINPPNFNNNNNNNYNSLCNIAKYGKGGVKTYARHLKKKTLFVAALCCIITLACTGEWSTGRDDNLPLEVYGHGPVTEKGWAWVVALSLSQGFGMGKWRDSVMWTWQAVWCSISSNVGVLINCWGEKGLGSVLTVNGVGSPQKWKDV